MSETLTRAISGVVYIAVLLTACWYSELSFKILMGIFLVLTTVEFSRLIKFNPLVGFFIAIGLYGVFGFFNNLGTRPDVFITIFSVITFLWLIKKLFDSSSLIITNNIYKYTIFIGYIVFSFIIITKIPTIESTYVPSKIIGLFVLIWKIGRAHV